MERQGITHQTKRRGFNLIEAAIVLGIVGVVIGGIWVAAASFYESYRVNKTVEGIAVIVRNTQRLVSVSDGNQLAASQSISCGAYGSELTSLLIAANGIPANWVKGNAVISPWGGGITIGNYCDSFSIRFLNLDHSKCIKLLIKESSIMALARARGGNLSNGSTEGNWIQVNWPSFGTGVFPITPQQATNACSLQTGNSIYFYYGYARNN